MGKDPMAAAEKEYQSYKIQKRKNDDKIKEIQDKVDQYLRDVAKLKEDYSALGSPIEKALFMETRYAIWTARSGRTTTNAKCLKSTYRPRI